MKLDISLLVKKRKFMLILLFGLVLGQMVISAIFPYITKYIIDDVLLKGRLTNLKSILIYTVTLIILQIPINIGVSYCSSKWVQLLIFDLRLEISQKFLTSKENSKENGLFINAIISDCEIIGNQLLTILLNGIPNVLLIILYSIALLNLSWKLTMNIMVVIPLFLFISWLTSKKVYSLSNELQKHKDRLTAFLNLYVHNKLAIDLYGLRDEEENNFISTSEKVKDSNIKTNTIMASLSTILGVITVFIPLMALFLGSVMVVNGELSLGSLIAFNSYTALLFSPWSKVLTIFPLLAQTKVSFKRIEQLNFSSVDGSRITGEYKTLSSDSPVVLKCENLSPCIDGEKLFKLPINFSISQGEILRVVGENGIGKSILLKCLVRYNQDFFGEICIKDDKEIIYVPQDNFLFEGTVYSNLVKGLKEYDEKQMDRLVQLLSFDVDFAKKVTPFKINLSTGQLQKIKIIRALLSNPDILILDETLANLDEATIFRLINYFKEINLAVIIVNHGSLNKFLKPSEYKTLELSAD